MGHMLSQIDIAPAKEKQFLSKGIESIEGLLAYLPRKYYDFRKPSMIRDLAEGKTQMVKGVVIAKSGGNPARLRLRDDDGYTMTISFFGSGWQYDRVNVGETWYIGGKIGFYNLIPTINNPIYVSQYPGNIMPVYSKIKGMSDDYLKNSIQRALDFLEANSSMDKKEQTAKALALYPKVAAYRELHSPSGEDAFRLARKRMDYEVIYDFYDELYRTKRFESMVSPVSVQKGTAMEEFINSLPFPLTKGQKGALETLRSQMVAGKHVNAIVSGDVGCGKTLVAIALSVLMWENGLQTAVMAPTLVLAKQHFSEFAERLDPLGIHVALLTSETKKRERTAILKGVKDGTIHVLVGTQSILSPELEFAALGTTIVDEEHKFGVKQKETIANFDSLGAHHVNMTATPIPRSYAMSVYGNAVDIITIPEMPAGRKETITKQICDEDTVYEEIYAELAIGHQAYIVTPFIEESDDEKFKDIASVAMTEAKANRYYAAHHPEIRVAAISGDMKQADILNIIDAFAAHQYDVLVSTTIIEVGVNIPNATVIAVMDADRFGLSGLHQLRGRVGRKGDQGYCYLVSRKESEKLDVLCSCHNGFEIAEKDMTLRGAGDLIGERQSGSDSARAIETILRRPKMAAKVRKILSE